jgi:hypothetical protein
MSPTTFSNLNKRRLIASFARHATKETNLTSTTTAAWDNVFEAVEALYELGWTDGLPVLPPTADKVAEFLAAAGRDGSEIVGELPERRREITAEKVAANAVMAGCRPEYMPVVLAAAQAMLAPEFNLVGPSSSMGGAATLVIVNGPIVQELGINARNNLFGPGNRANSTIGRAMRLILMNACAAIPGLYDRSVIGHPGKFSYCIAENEEETHWNPLHVDRGFSREQSAVTVFACEGPRQVRMAAIPEIILEGVADVASSLGSSLSNSGSVADTTVPVRQGQIALVVAGTRDVWEGWSKDDVRRYLRPRVRRSVADLKRVLVIKGDPEPGDDTRYIQLVPDPEDILVVFGGGAEGPVSALIPSWGPKVSSTAVTKAVRPPAL